MKEKNNADWEPRLKNIFYREFEEVGIIAIDSTYESVYEFIKETREQAYKDGFKKGEQYANDLEVERRLQIINGDSIIMLPRVL